MELSQEFIENSIYLKDIFELYNLNQEWQELTNEIILIILEETAVQDNIIQLIRRIKMHNYEDARKYMIEYNAYAREIFTLRCVIKSLLKGLIATSSVSQLSDITDSKIRWQKYDAHQDFYDPQGHHNQVYLEFKKVETMAELEKFNNYFHNYVLDLVYGFSEIYIRRTRFTIDYFRDDKQLEEAFAKGTINLEKFEKDLEEAKAFIPGPSDLVPRDDKPGTAGQWI